MRCPGPYTAVMHEREVLHLDYSPGNILWDKDDEGYHFTVVDINRMRFGKVVWAVAAWPPVGPQTLY